MARETEQTGEGAGDRGERSDDDQASDGPDSHETGNAAPRGEVPAGEVPAGERPAADSPAGDETPGDEPSREDLPRDDLPREDLPREDPAADAAKGGCAGAVSEPGGDADRQLAPDIGSARTPTQPKRRKMIDGGFAVVIAMALASGVLVWIQRGPARFWEILGMDVGLILSIAPKVMAAVLLAAWMRLLIPRETIARYFGGESGFRGLVFAVIAGVILPGGPMTAFPIAVAFGVAGADAGAAAAFLTSWLLLGANRTIVWEMAFIQHDVVGWRLLLSLPIPFLIGYVARVIGRPSTPPAETGARAGEGAR